MSKLQYKVIPALRQHRTR
ncbi:hypothetical protein Bhyg_17659 [Pseudolycoriella hygida]|uniref:Uncharacterized protein n=1 Tax=Pseudolycoriella hygida TaxID=35572 RepID=A0A9Q0RS64_9DIPT|nr:hypothetical protein Bhyg_17659 [Pseudolycoriella hygida]